MMRDWPHPGYGLHAVLLNRDVDFGDSGKFLAPIHPGAFLAGLLCGIAPCSGMQHPVSDLLGVNLFSPFGLRLSPERSDRGVKEVSRLAVAARRWLRAIDSVENVRIVVPENNPFLGWLVWWSHSPSWGVRFHTQEPKRLWRVASASQSWATSSLLVRCV